MWSLSFFSKASEASLGTGIYMRLFFFIAGAFGTCYSILIFSGKQGFKELLWSTV